MDVEWAIYRNEPYVLQVRPAVFLVSRFDWREYRSPFQQSLESVVEPELAAIVEDLRSRRDEYSVRALRVHEEWEKEHLPTFIGELVN